jgi:hypothetical protein
LVTGLANKFPRGCGLKEGSMASYVALLGIILTLAGCAASTSWGFYSSSPELDPYYSDPFYGPPYSYPSPQYSEPKATPGAGISQGSLGWEPGKYWERQFKRENAPGEPREGGESH